MRKTFSIAALMALTFIVWNCSQTSKMTGQTASGEIHTPAFDPSPSPTYYSPEESMKRLYLPEGYHVELVASEPMIEEPVSIAWDGNGKMYVAEMLSYMKDADATGEQQSISKILLLEDTNHDGKMDKSSVFIDSLLLPRMMQCVNHELLVNETNTIDIYSYKDTNGDGKADVKKLLYRNDKYVLGDRNMEHQRSGLDWNLDNWMYVTYDPVRFRYTDGTIKVDTMASGSTGQWGVTHDNYGRVFFSRAGSEIAVLGFQLNPAYGQLEFKDQYTAEFNEVWPIIATPDVQGGPGRLRENKTLNHFTGACGQSIFRGDKLPADLVGDYIVCEPVARIIRRAKIENKDGKTTLHNAYQKQEFISSSDMNFRPVNSYTGPDGNLYIVDMNHGIIQQGNWTRPGSFLRNKIDSLGMDKHVGHGRIYRVVHDGFKPGPQPHMLDESSKDLVKYLGHENGWWRDNAQKEIIARHDKSVVPDLEKMVANSKSGELAKIHALWTLEGLDAISKNVLLVALKDESPQVRRTAVWISEQYLNKNDDEMIAGVSALKNDESPDVLVQLVLSLGNAKSEKAKAVAAEIVASHSGNEMITASKAAMESNENLRTYGSRLGRMETSEREMILKGQTIFKSLCAACHGADGKGVIIGDTIAPAPSLVQSGRLALTDRTSIVKILLKGLTGPIDGKMYSSLMPPMEANNDEWVASVASYVRYEFGSRGFGRGGFPGGGRGANNGPVVTVDEVKQIRTEVAGRNKPWTLEELTAAGG